MELNGKKVLTSIEAIKALPPGGKGLDRQNAGSWLVAKYDQYFDQPAQLLYQLDEGNRQLRIVDAESDESIDWHGY